MRVYLFYYLKWRHLVNRITVQNAILKHNGVGRRLAHTQDERCRICGTYRRPRSTVSINDEKVFSQRAQDYCQTSVQGAAISSDTPSYTA